MKNYLEVLETIRDIRPERSLDNIRTRIMKLCEESGEAAGALISIEEGSYKKLTNADLIEEIIDCWIVATDAMLTKIGDVSDEEHERFIMDIMKRKISKWAFHSGVKNSTVEGWNG